MTLGEKIREARLSKNILQKDLAEQLTLKGFKTTNATISNWELNISEPDIDTLDAICDILEKDANYFLDRKQKIYSLDISDLTSEELKELEQYKEFLKSKRNK